MKKIVFLSLLLCAATCMHAADTQPTPPATPPVDTSATPAETLTTDYLLWSILKQVTQDEADRALYAQKYQPLFNKTLATLQETDLKAYDALMTPIIENQAGSLDVEKAKTLIKNSLSKGSLAYKLFTDMQQRYMQELEASNQITERINTALDKKYQRMHLQLQISAAATILVGYLQISKLLGYKLFPFFKAARKVEVV
jgi:hypothetical protein